MPDVFDYINMHDDPWDLKKIGKNETIVKVLNRFIGRIGIVVDIGGGYGFYADALRECGNRSFVVEKSDKMLIEGKKMFHDVDFVKGDATKLPFTGSAFDAALCMGTLMYINNKQGFFSDVKRILKPGGVFLIYERNKKAALNRLVRLFKNTEKNADSPDMFLSKNEIKKLAEKSGFSIKKFNGGYRTFILALLVKDRF